MSLWLWCTLAWAGGFAHRESRDPLPAREVARDLVLPKGWAELSMGASRARWDAGSDSRPFPGELARRELWASVRASLGDRWELRARLPWSDVSTGTVLGAGVGSATVGAAASLGRGVAPRRSAAVTLAWTVPDGRGRVPLGAATHVAVLGVAARQQVGGLRVTARGEGLASPAGRVGWLDDAAGLSQTVDRGEAVRGAVETLLQAGPVGVDLGWGVGFHGPDRIDGVVVVPSGVAARLDVSGLVQLTRAVQGRVGGWSTLRSRGDVLAPSVDVSQPGRGLCLSVGLAL